MFPEYILAQARDVLSQPSMPLDTNWRRRSLAPAV